MMYDSRRSPVWPHIMAGVFGQDVETIRDAQVFPPSPGNLSSPCDGIDYASSTLLIVFISAARKRVFVCILLVHLYWGDEFSVQATSMSAKCALACQSVRATFFIHQAQLCSELCPELLEMLSKAVC
jgi:hypothetical protein